MKWINDVVFNVVVTNRIQGFYLPPPGGGCGEGRRGDCRKKYMNACTASGASRFRFLLGAKQRSSTRGVQVLTCSAISINDQFVLTFHIIE